jgi:hypothetical protein
VTPQTTPDEERRLSWTPLIEAVVAAPGPETHKHQLLKHALRLVTWSYRPTLASQAVADHIWREHTAERYRTCDHRFMERAHPVDVAALAKDLAAGAVSVTDALRRLQPIVWLTRQQHRAVGDFGTREHLEELLGERLVDWRRWSPRGDPEETL